MTANRAASIHARLKQHPETSKRDFALTQYGLERLLHRLSISSTHRTSCSRARDLRDRVRQSRTRRHAVTPPAAGPPNTASAR